MSSAACSSAGSADRRAAISQTYPSNHEAGRCTGVATCCTGRYLSGIARTLNAEGIPSPGSVRRRPDGRVKALAWSAAGLGKMLTNRVLLGELTFRGKAVRNDVGGRIYVTDEPLIDKATWNDLQHALAAISRPKNGNRKADHLLLRIAYCGECDTPLYYQGYQAGPKGRYPYYRCRTVGFDLGLSMAVGAAGIAAALFT